jgi:hypothetical protein
MGNHTEERAQSALVVRVLGMDVNGRPIMEAARTVNISRLGLVIEGLQSRLKPGEVVSLQYKGRKVRYRVLWAGDAKAETAGQLGLEQINHKDDLWQQDLPPENGRDTRVPGTDRRRRPRFEAALPVEVKSAQATPIRAEITDISLNGCYVNTLFPVPLDSNVTIVFWLGDDKLVVKGKTCTSVLGLGCGIKFADLSAAAGQRLTEYLENRCKPAKDRRAGAAGRRATEVEITIVQAPSSRIPR